MIFKVNGNPIDITLENEKTIGEVLKAFEAEAEKNDAATLKIYLDKKQISPDEFDSILEKPILDDTELELSVITKNDIAEAFKLSLEAFTKLSEKLCNIPVMLQSGKDKDANLIITELAAEIERFCHAAALSALFPDAYGKLLIDGMDTGRFFADFSPVLSDFEAALESKDTVTIGDICEYEISPRLINLTEALKTVI